MGKFFGRARPRANWQDEAERLKAENMALRIELEKLRGQPSPIEPALPTDLPKEARELLNKAKERESTLLGEVERLKQEKQAAVYLDEAKGLPFVIGMSVNQLAGLLFSVDTLLPAEVASGLRQHLRATNECMKTSELFKVYGTTRSGDQSPMEQLETLAKQIQARDPSLTDVLALDEAGRLRPDLYGRAQRAQEGAPR